ncbi:MAG: hypothetical protein ACKOXZ_08205 [Polynucleobacter victoriensis]
MIKFVKHLIAVLVIATGVSHVALAASDLAKLSDAARTTCDVPVAITKTAIKCFKNLIKVNLLS